MTTDDTRKIETTPDGSSLDQWVLVTGSSRGIGRGIALTLARRGYHVAVHCVGNVDRAEQTANDIQQMGRESRVLQFDVADREMTRQVLETDVEAHGVYYGVVCNAGVTSDGIFPMLSGDDWDRVVHTNLDGFYNVLHPLVMPLIKTRQPRRIVTMASVSGMMGNRGQVNYSAAKAGIIGATKALATELASRKITVNCVAPGLIDTDMTEDLRVDEMLKAIPLGRLGTTEEVASVVAFLLSTDAAYVTRQVIAVNGGMF